MIIAAVCISTLRPPRARSKGPFRRFQLVRQVGVSGVSVTGSVAEGIRWSSSKSALS